MFDLKWILIGVGASLLASSTAIAQSEEPTERSPVHDPAPPAESEPEPRQDPESRSQAESAPAPAARVEPDEPFIAPAESETPAAPAEPRVAFGSKGQWVLLGSSNYLSLLRRTLSSSSAKYSDFSAELGVDSFVAKNVSIGFDLSASLRDDQSYDITILRKSSSSSIAAGARFGFNLPLGQRASWWPRLTLGLEWSHLDTTDLSSSIGAPLGPPSSASSVGPWLNLYAPLLAHPAPHFVIGFGPRFAHTFAETRGGPYDGAQSTTISADFVLGGWWGGPARDPSTSEHDGRAEDEDFAQPTKRVARAFGGAGQLVLTTATDASISARFYSRSSGSNTSVNLSPALDYFLAENVSIGVDTFVGYSKSTALDVTGDTVHANSTSFGFGPRFGVNLPITQALSLWPVLEFGAGTLDTSQSSASGVNQHSKQRTWIALTAPLLVHPATHFFFGAGPVFFHELLDKDQYDYENDATVLGLSFVLGGWV